MTRVIASVYMYHNVHGTKRSVSVLRERQVSRGHEVYEREGSSWRRVHVASQFSSRRRPSVLRRVRTLLTTPLLEGVGF